MMLQGVNLGGWLVLEKWMTPSLFDGTTTADETYFCHDLGEDRARERLKTFRDTFIQRRDFAEIADHGFNAMRIPVPFFIFEDIGPYIHCYEYLDRVFRRVALAPEFADDLPSGGNPRNLRESARLVPHGSEVWSAPRGHRSAFRCVRVFRCRTSRDGCAPLRPSCESRAGRNPAASNRKFL